MTVPTTIDAAGWLRNHLEDPDCDGDLARSMLAAFAQALMSTEASMQCQAGYGERTDEPVNSRNGYRERRWDTRVGTIDLQVPKMREGSYVAVDASPPGRAGVGVGGRPGLRRRGVDAPGGGPGRGDGIAGISKSEVSRLAADLDAKVAEFRERPLDAGPYRYLWFDALTQKVREGGRVVNVSAVIATTVNNEGRRETVGVRHRHHRVHHRLDRVPAVAGGPRAVRGRAGGLRRPRRHQSHDRGRARRRVVAEMPDAS